MDCLSLTSKLVLTSRALAASFFRLVLLFICVLERQTSYQIPYFLPINFKKERLARHVRIFEYLKLESAEAERFFRDRASYRSGENVLEDML